MRKKLEQELQEHKRTTYGGNDEIDEATAKCVVGVQARWAGEAGAIVIGPQGIRARNATV